MVSQSWVSLCRYHGLFLLISSLTSLTCTITLGDTTTVGPATPTCTTDSAATNASDMCNNYPHYCSDLENITQYSLTNNEYTKILNCCIQGIFRSDSSIDNSVQMYICERFSPFQSQSREHYCTNNVNRRICKYLCGVMMMMQDDRVSNCCGEPRRILCTSFVTGFRPLNEEGEEDLAFSIITYQEDLDVGEVADGINNILSSISKRRGRLNDNSARHIYGAYNNIFGDQYSHRKRKERKNRARNILDGLIGSTTQLGKDFVNRERNSTFNYAGRNIATKVQRLKPSGQRTTKFEYPLSTDNVTLEGEASIAIPYTALCSDADNEDCSVVVGVTIAGENFVEYIQEMIDNNTNNSNLSVPVSVLVTALVFDSETYIEGLRSNPVVLTFTPNTVNNTNFTYSYTCVFLDTNDDDNLEWNSSGITTTLLDDGRVQCISYHLTSFTILVSINGESYHTQEEELAIRIVTYIGCGVSIISLTATIVILLTLRKKLKKGVLLYVHVNMSLSLLLALIIFVAGLETATFNEELCIAVAAFIQYFFLCAFFWMLCEAIMLYILVVRVFGKMAKKWYFLLPLGWGVPILIVAISVGIWHEDYKTDNYCWIEANFSKAAIWTFIIPMLIVLAINSVILVLTIASIVKGKKQGGAESNVKNIQLVKSAIKSMIILLPLLGLTWIIGLFAVNRNTTVFSWIFTVLNSFQGFFFFFLHVMRNEVVLKMTKNLFLTTFKKCWPCHKLKSTDDKKNSLTLHTSLSKDQKDFTALSGTSNH